jgi:hypothetical protein
MKDEEVEKIIRSNMSLQMNLAGIRTDFEEKLQPTWVGLTDEERNTIGRHHAYVDNIIRATEAKLKEKNT